MADHEDDIPMTDEEHALAERGRLLVAAAVAHPEARAPQALREALAEAATPAAPAPAPAPRRRRRARALVGGLGALAVAAVAAVALVLALGEAWPGDRPDAPSLQQIAAVARMPADAAPPAAIGGTPPRLDARVGRLAFPDWRAAYDWRATGQRSDRVGGRAVTTVFYRYRHGDQTTIGYAILAGPPVGLGPGREIRRRGERYRVFRSAGRRTVTWTQAGHTCVIDAPSTVSATELVKLASWA